MNDMMDRQASMPVSADEELFIRKWHKLIPMKAAHEAFGLYSGTWSKLMDRYWESNDGYCVSSRQIRTAWGVVEHVSISRMNGDRRDLPWAVKQQIKDELFGTKATAIEVFPARKHLVDACDIYHLWVLPKGFALPFGLHPTRDPQGYRLSAALIFPLRIALHGRKAKNATG